jgi:LysM repeat protein
MTRKAVFFVALLITVSAFANAQERYTVAAGDSLSKIGRKFGMPYREVMAANQLKSTTIYIGQVLTIPKSPPSGESTPIAIARITAPPVFDRYRSPGTSKTSPIERINAPGMGEFSGELPISPSPPAAPSAYARPIASYPPPFQDRYGVPPLPGNTGVSPYNDGSPSTGRSQPKPVSTQVKNQPPFRPKTRTVPISSRKGGTYVVQGGDSIRSISKDFGVSFWELRTANRIQFKRIYPGQILKIPTRSR